MLTLSYENIPKPNVNSQGESFQKFFLIYLQPAMPI